MVTRACAMPRRILPSAMALRTGDGGCARARRGMLRLDNAYTALSACFARYDARSRARLPPRSAQAASRGLKPATGHSARRRPVVRLQSRSVVPDACEAAGALAPPITGGPVGRTPADRMVRAARGFYRDAAPIRTHWRRRCGRCSTPPKRRALRAAAILWRQGRRAAANRTLETSVDLRCRGRGRRAVDTARSCRARRDASRRLLPSCASRRQNGARLPHEKRQIAPTRCCGPRSVRRLTPRWNRMAHRPWRPGAE